jgi:2-oxoglutarate dehydrogenase E1 component
MVKALRADARDECLLWRTLMAKPATWKDQNISILGIAIDLAKPDGTRQLLVPSIKGCEGLDFGQFWVAYEEIVKKARGGTLTVEDYAGTTVSLDKPWNYRNSSLRSTS